MLFRKAILLIHGFAGGSYDYHTLANDLQLYKNFDVYTFTLPGHEKARIKNVTKEDWIESAEAQIEKLIKNGYKKIYVIGHSMGGVIACHLAKKYPQIKKLVLASPAFRYFTFKDGKLDLIESIKQTPDIIKDYTPEYVISTISKLPISTTLEFINLVKEHNHDVKDVLCPTLILWGTEDIIVPKEGAIHVYKNIKSDSVTLYEIKGITHETFKNERYNEILEIITKFLKEIPLSEKKINKI